MVWVECFPVNGVAEKTHNLVIVAALCDWKSELLNYSKTFQYWHWPAVYSTGSKPVKEFNLQINNSFAQYIKYHIDVTLDLFMFYEYSKAIVQVHLIKSECNCIP